MALSPANNDAPAPAPAASSTDRMRAATRQIHDQSSRLVLLQRALILTHRPLYGEAISLFAPIFQELESLVAKHAMSKDSNNDMEQVFAKIHPLLQQMKRGDAFVIDQDFYLGKQRRMELAEAWTVNNDPLWGPYKERLAWIDQHDPLLLLAYIYHLYGALVAGGQIIKRGVRRSFGLPRNQIEGIAIFSLPLDKTYQYPSSYLKHLKKILNSDLNLTPAQEEAIIEEGVRVFQMNNVLMSSISSSPAWSQASSQCVRFLVVVAAIMLGLMLAYIFWIRQSAISM